MTEKPKSITLAQWDERYAKLAAAGLREPSYGGPLRRHVRDGDLRLLRLRFDNSPAALRLWNFLLTEEDRLAAARAAGKKIVGAMKDLGTVPVMAYSLANVVAFYPDGAWWIPCVMELSSPMLAVADSLGIDESFCPVRAMLGAFLTGSHFPIPDLLACSAGATCDDFSAIAQRLEGLGFPILWWEMPARRRPEEGEEAVPLPGGLTAPRCQVDLVKSEFARLAEAIGSLAGEPLEEPALREGIRQANRVRRLLAELRQLVFTAPLAPLPALELLIAEMLAIHFCSDRGETIAVLGNLLAESRRRVARGEGFGEASAARVFWVNPVADLRAMNLMESAGCRICGTDFMFAHALDEIPEDVPPLEALARTAMADPMAGAAADRASRICYDARRFGAEAVLVSRIPGASHCATEGSVIAAAVAARLGLPVVEIEISPLIDATEPSLRTRIEALVETVQKRRNREQGTGNT
jgi:benzoyl-CoA reductase/2-hydroxyglutaryl-CoA dehydratase subunit BcrC/BadD/HgdB